MHSVDISPSVHVSLLYVDIFSGSGVPLVMRWERRDPPGPAPSLGATSLPRGGPQLPGLQEDVGQEGMTLLAGYARPLRRSDWNVNFQITLQFSNQHGFPL